MKDSELLQSLYVGFAFLVQALLILNFTARNWKPGLERSYGWIIYALGIPSLLLGIFMLVDGRPWYFVLAPLLYAVWAVLGSVVDLWRQVAWRSPPLWPIFITYVGLFTASLLMFWVSMWYVGEIYWIAFGVLYVGHTCLNIYSHRRKPLLDASNKGI